MDALERGHRAGIHLHQVGDSKHERPLPWNDVENATLALTPGER
jgi:hypothetical protein